jgi:hypothetical protein
MESVGKNMTRLELAEAYLQVKQTCAVYLATAFIEDSELGSSQKDEIACRCGELKKAVPLLDDIGLLRLFFDGFVFVEFDDLATAREFYNTVVGEDGPTPTNPYTGPAKVFAVLGDPSGWLTENT